jgi:hypothetical protein
VFSSSTLPRSLGSAWLDSADAIMAAVPMANGRISLLASSLSLALTSFLRDFSNDGFLSLLLLLLPDIFEAVLLVVVLLPVLTRFVLKDDVNKSVGLFAIASDVVMLLLFDFLPRFIISVFVWLK